MANEALRMDLFGPSPAEVMQARQGQNYDQAMAWGQVDPLRSGQISGAMAGQAFGQALGGALGGQDPAYEKAQRMQMAQMETEEFARANGIDLATKPQDYYKLATQTLSKYGLANEAAQVAEIARMTALQEREMRFKERPDARQGVKMSGNIMYGPDGSYKVIPEYQGKGSDKAQSPAGKLVADRAKLVEQYGEDSQQVAEFDKAAKEPNAMERLMQQIDARAEAQDRNNAAIAARQADAAERSATAADRAAVNKQLFEYVDNLGKKAGANREVLSSVNTAISQIEKSRFEPGFASKFRNKIGEVASYLGYPEIADGINSNAGDAATLNASLKNVVADLSVAGQGAGDNNRSARELEFFQDSIGNTGVVEEGLYQALKMRAKQLEYSDAEYEAALQFAEQARQEANAAGDPTSADIRLRQKMFDWKKEHPSAITGRDWDQFRRSAELMKKAKTAKPLNTFLVNPPKQGEAPTPPKWQGLKPGMIVVDDDGIVKVFTGKFNTYEPGKTYTIDGQSVKFPVKTTIPELSAYK